MFDEKIDAVIDLAMDEPATQMPRGLIYCRIPLLDGSGNSDASLVFAVKTVVNLVSGGHTALVACSAGMSRSPAIVAAALSVLESGDPDEMLSKIAEFRSLESAPELWRHIKSVLPTVCVRWHE